MEKYTIYSLKWVLGIAICFCILAQKDLQAQVPNEIAIEYISQYKDYAVEEMRRTGIPASITLAQALHESNYGRSRLAVLANNHFGLKCHRSWKGKTILHDDDALNECFRKFDDPYDSFVDHSKCLEKKRYRFLFDLDKYDYEAWAHGLKKAGYATDPYYGYKLINIIERYSLYVYDLMEYISPDQLHIHQEVYVEPAVRYEWVALSSKEMYHIPAKKLEKGLPIDTKIGKLPYQEPIKINKRKGLKYSIAVWPVQISETYNISLEELMALNDMPHNDPIPAFTNIYLEERRSRAEFGFEYHEVKVGESMREIALAYGVNMESLYKLNRIKEGVQIVPGEVLHLRKAAPYAPRVYTPHQKDQLEPVQPVAPEDRLYFVNDNSLKNFFEEEENKSQNAPVKQTSMVEVKDAFYSKAAPIKGSAVYNSSTIDKVEPSPTTTADPIKRTTKKADTTYPANKTLNTVATGSINSSSNKRIIYTATTPENIGDKVIFVESKPVVEKSSTYINTNTTYTNTIKSAPSSTTNINTTTDTPTTTNTITTAPHTNSNYHAVAKKPESSKQFHIVQKGENLYRISLKYKVSVDEIKRLNKLDSNIIYTGTNLRIK